MDPKKNIINMEDYIPPLDGRRGMLRLDFNENTLGPSPKVLETLRNLKDTEISAYPEYAQFQQKLSDYLKIDLKNLVITNATDEAISVIMQTYISPGDQVIIPVPTFAMFKFYAEVAGAKITEVLLNPNLQFPLKRVLKQITKKTKLVIVCSPNNPTGLIIKRKDIVKVLETGALVLVDEAYSQFSGESCSDLIDKYSNLIVIQTFSKAFGLGGLRLGYALSNEAIIKNLKKVRSPYSVNSAAVKAGLAALDDKDYLQWYIKQIKLGKKYVYDEFEKLRIKTYPTDANFFLAKFGKNAEDIVEKLKTKGILVRDRSSYKLLKGCVRITIGTKTQMKQLVKAIIELK
ncbi:MAG: histidinol-phosphate transaminase [Nanoarchaeota archaeon]